MTAELIAQKLFEHGWIIGFSALSFALSADCFARRKPVVGLVFFVSGALLIAIGSRFLHWTMTLGTDSYLEALHSGFDEAKFWGTTFVSMFPQLVMPLSKTQLLVVVASACITLLLIVAAKRMPTLRVVYVSVFILGITVALSLAWIRLLHGRAFAAELKAEFSSPPLQIASTANDLDLLVFIGESITTLNMQVYGYPLPTTPGLVALRDDPGFLLFGSVRSTHTHTSPSLLDALAVKVRGLDASAAKIGIGDALQRAAITGTLFSTQPESGAFAQASDLIFDGLVPREAITSNASAKSGSRELDHELLERALRVPGVVFFHSYAGHGPYEENIAADLSRPIATPDISFDGIFGGAIPKVSRETTSTNRAAYDRAITYLDNNLTNAIAHIRSRDRPAALIFFSDHGESVYTNRGHDSSMYIDEMTTVPVIVYFNEAYRARYTSTFDRFRIASASRQLRLLDQIGPSILDILMAEPQTPLTVPSLTDNGPHPKSIIVERDTLLGRTSINLALDHDEGFSRRSFIGGTPEPTYIAVINQEFGRNHGICYHRTNSFAKAVRAAAVTDCLEVDVVVENGSLDVRHPPAGRTGFTLEHVFDIVSGRQKKIWIDGKNIDEPKACEALSDFIRKNANRVNEILIEFPSNIISADPSALACARQLREDGFRTSFYIPSDTASRCSAKETDADACATLSRIVTDVVRSEAFSDLSFDFSGYAAIKTIASARSLRWNTWTIRADSFLAFPRQDFDLIIMDSYADPNGI